MKPGLCFIFFGILLVVAIILSLLIYSDSHLENIPTNKAGLYLKPSNDSLCLIGSTGVFDKEQDSTFYKSFLDGNNRPKLMVYGIGNQRLVAYAMIDTVTNKFKWIISDTSATLNTLIKAVETQSYWRK
jgi:hypothetical protein